MIRVIYCPTNKATLEVKGIAIFRFPIATQADFTGAIARIRDRKSAIRFQSTHCIVFVSKVKRLTQPPQEQVKNVDSSVVENATRGIAPAEKRFGSCLPSKRSA